jgi:flagellar motor switch protein FliM
MPNECEHVSSEINPQFAQIADENDLVVLSRFEADATASGGKGFIDLVYPYASLKPVRDLLRSRVQTGDGNEESDNQWRNDLGVAVDSASVEMRVMLGDIPTSLGSIESMQPGDVLFFKKPDLARLLINEVPAFDVEVGNLGSQTAVQIQRSVIPGMQ